MTENKGNDLVPGQTKTGIMGDGTTNAALKGSLKGRKRSPLIPRRREARRFGGLPACPHTPVPAFAPAFKCFPQQLSGARYGSLLSHQCF